MKERLNIGHHVQRLRLEQNLTLYQLAEISELSPSYLSQIENSKASPSITSLRRIARALKSRIVDFFADELIEDPPIMPPTKWTRVNLPGWKAIVHQLVHIVGDKRMQPFHTVVPPGGGTTENYSHPGEEFGFVLKGELTLKLGSEIHTLEAGTAVYYPSLIPHSWMNRGKENCGLIWVVSPPSW